MHPHSPFHAPLRRHAAALGLSILVGLIAFFASGQAHGLRPAPYGLAVAADTSTGAPCAGPRLPIL
ncbi:hypothetical protein [Luteimonas aquatica]|uniref:hypothetical protein n=1 Tax=Luteimonas aquatica TaxID=450364 RepID=UPI001F5693B1|nr:hypothetical protein [Luteimonas aquatica]